MKVATDWLEHYLQKRATWTVMVSASRDGDVAAWDVERGTLVARAKTGEKEIRDCAILPDSRRVISAHASGRISVWDLRTMTSRATFVVPRSTPRRIRRFASHLKVGD